MSNPIIEVKNISKKYDINHEQGRYVALRDVLTNIAKSPFSFLKSKAKKVVGLEKKEDFWALKNINFTIEAGEVVGIIGPNGAGKSTLLKILSQITPPTAGEIILRGRVGSLLEVGTGFHPELTGRENIFLNGAILGMKHYEIATKFDVIVEFAGIEKFLDTPVKYYSSGMYVRLAFSVAAHMEPDILIVDEVLAVGDAEFQKKCLGKMGEITEKDGRTILFVSHKLEAVQNLCKKTLLLNKGCVEKIGDAGEVINHYLKKTLRLQNTPLKDRKDRTGDGRLRIIDFKINGGQGEQKSSLETGDDVEIELFYEKKDPQIKKINVAIAIDHLPSQYRVAQISNKVINQDIKVVKEIGNIKIYLKKLPLNKGVYQFTVFVDEAGKILDWIKAIGTFQVVTGKFYKSGKEPSQGTMLLDYNFIHDPN